MKVPMTSPSNNLFRMGIALIAMGAVFSSLAYLTPEGAFSSDSREGVYVMSLLFAGLGIYCFPIWKR